jgi:hypothetical protein
VGGYIMANKKYKVYVDTCIVSKIFDNSIDPKDLKALYDLVQNNNIDFNTSHIALEEFLNNSDDNKRAGLAVLFKLFKLSPKHRSTVSLVCYGAPLFGEALFNDPNEKEDPLLKSIKEVFTQKDRDPEHIFQAVKSECDYFLTLDERSILRKARNNFKKLNQICPNIKFVSPIELLKDYNLIS